MKNLNPEMLKSTAAVSVHLDNLSQRMSAGNFLVYADFTLFHFLCFLIGIHLKPPGKFQLWRFLIGVCI